MQRRSILRAMACGLLLAGCGTKDGRFPKDQARPAPELNDGGAWINTEPLTMAGLRGNVVLIDFWTYGCYNCRNTLPAMQGWWQEFSPQGLVIIGVHTPEFRAEHELANVQQAVIQQQIGWPIVQDNDYAIWNAYHNHYWPHFFLINRKGLIIYDHIGEGAYDITAQHIRAALAEPA